MKQGRTESKERALPAPNPCFMRMWGWVQRPTEDSRTPGANTSLSSPHVSWPNLSMFPKEARGWPSAELPTQPGYTDNGRTHSDQLIMLPITSSTMRSWREAETRELRDRERSGGRPVRGSPPHPWALSCAPRAPQWREEEEWR